MENSVKSYESSVYRIRTRGDQINLNIRNDSYELICWSVDNHCQYQTPPIVYTMSKNEMKGLADFIYRYLEK